MITRQMLAKASSDTWKCGPSYPRWKYQRLQIHTSGSVPSLDDKQPQICPEQVYHTWHTASHGHLGNHAHAHNGWTGWTPEESETCRWRWLWSWTTFWLKRRQNKIIKLWYPGNFHNPLGVFTETQNSHYWHQRLVVTVWKEKKIKINNKMLHLVRIELGIATVLVQWSLFSTKLVCAS